MNVLNYVRVKPFMTGSLHASTFTDETAIIVNEFPLLESPGDKYVYTPIG